MPNGSDWDGQERNRLVAWFRLRFRISEVALALVRFTSVLCDLELL